MESVNFIDACKQIEQMGIKEFYFNGIKRAITNVNFCNRPENKEVLLRIGQAEPLHGQYVGFDSSPFVVSNLKNSIFIEKQLVDVAKESDKVFIFTKRIKNEETIYKIVIN